MFHKLSFNYSESKIFIPNAPISVTHPVAISTIPTKIANEAINPNINMLINICGRNFIGFNSLPVSLIHHYVNCFWDVRFFIVIVSSVFPSPLGVFFFVGASD